MIKARAWKNPYEMIDTLTKENGGVPLTNVISGQALTKEYWDELQKKIQAIDAAHSLVEAMDVKLKKLTFL